jgi:tetratricopeptide (TPR) repeat protein
MLALLVLAQGRDDQATAYAQEALALAETNGDEWLRAVALDCLGRCVNGQDYARAAAYYRQSATGFRKTGDRHALCAPLFQLGVISRLSRDMEKAKSIFEEGLASARQIRDPASSVWFLAGLGELAFASEDYHQAQHYLGECLAIAEEGDVYWEPVPDLTGTDDLADALHARSAAAEHFEEAIKLAVAMQFPNRVLEPLVRLAELLVGNSGRA